MSSLTSPSLVPSFSRIPGVSTFCSTAAGSSLFQPKSDAPADLSLKSEANSSAPNINLLTKSLDDHLFNAPLNKPSPFDYLNMAKPRSNSIPNFQTSSHFATFLSSHKMKTENKEGSRTPTQSPPKSTSTVTEKH